jgi:hypothetical protein
MTEDLFRQPTGGGNFPKLDDLEGCLVLLKPSKLEVVPGYKGKGTQDRITADTWVFGPELDPEKVESYSDMYFSQAGIVPSCKQALKPGGLPYVLGVVTKFPSKDLKASGIDTPEKVQKAYSDWLRKGGKGEKPQFAWGLAEFTDEQAAAARKLIDKLTRDSDPFTAASA